MSVDTMSDHEDLLTRQPIRSRRTQSCVRCSSSTHVARPGRARGRAGQREELHANLHSINRTDIHRISILNYSALKFFRGN